MKKNKEEALKKSKERYEKKFPYRSSFRLTDSQKKIIDKKRGQLSVPDYLISVGLNSKTKLKSASNSQINLRNDILIELHRHGNNLNQIARYFNSMKELNLPQLDSMQKMVKETFPIYSDFLQKLNKS